MIFPHNEFCIENKVKNIIHRNPEFLRDQILGKKNHFENRRNSRNIHFSGCGIALRNTMQDASLSNVTLISSCYPEFIPARQQAGKGPPGTLR